MFSSPLWGFFYLIVTVDTDGYVTIVLVPSLGILLFNTLDACGIDKRMLVLVPSLGILLFNKNMNNLKKLQAERSRPLSGDSFI